MYLIRPAQAFAFCVGDELKLFLGGFLRGNVMAGMPGFAVSF
jgi:hypothetical protein